MKPPTKNDPEYQEYLKYIVEKWSHVLNEDTSKSKRSTCMIIESQEQWINEEGS